MSSTMTLSETMVGPQSDARAGKYLTFHLANEEFGIRVLIEGLRGRSRGQQPRE